MRCSPSVSMMSTAMSRNLPSYSRAWWPQKTRSLPLASTTRTLANAPQRSQWNGTTRSSVVGVVSISVIGSSLALYRTDPQLRIGLLHSARMDPAIPVPFHLLAGLAVVGKAGSAGTDGGTRQRTSLVSCCYTVVLLCWSGRRPVWVRCLLCLSHGTRLTRVIDAYTTALARTGEIVTKPQSGDVPGSAPVVGKPTLRSEGPHTRLLTQVVPGRALKGSGPGTTSALSAPGVRLLAAVSAGRPTMGLVEVVPEDLGPARVAQLGHRLRLDLPDPLTRDPVDLADLVEGARLAVGETEAQADDAGLPLRQRLQHAGQLVLHEREADRVDRHDGLGVLDEVAELAVALVADRLVEADRLPGVLLDLQHLVRGDVHLLGQLLRGGLAAQVLEQLALDATELVDDLDHVHRDADGAGLVGHGAGDRLPDPPGGVRGELVALGVVELLDRADQSEVALLDQVQERHAAAGVALGQGDHEAEVGFQEVVLGPLAVADDPVEVAAHLRGELLALLLDLAQPLGGVEPGLDPLGEVDLLLRVEQRDLADLLEVGADRVGRGGELGVLAGLPQRLGLLLVVPLEVGGGLFLLAGGRGDLAVGGAVDDTVGAGDDRLVEGQTLGALSGGRVGDGGEDGTALGAGGGGDGGLAPRAGLGGCLLPRRRCSGLRSCLLGNRCGGPRGPGPGGDGPGPSLGGRGGCFRCWLVGGHSGSFPCWVVPRRAV